MRTNLISQESEVWHSLSGQFVIKKGGHSPKKANCLELPKNLLGLYSSDLPADSGGREKMVFGPDWHSRQLCIFSLLNGDQRVTEDHRDEPLHFKMLGREKARGGTT